MDFNTLSIVKQAARLLDIPDMEAAKAKTTPRETIKISEKITWKNFYKNPSFWERFALAVLAGAAGDNMGAITAAIHIFN